ncbi:MAG TPA: hypothetical protein VJ023_17745 [Pyrinomonadaceae bacterium]|nr:hypothetical protein [Pyrinomonadaceae bacterium]
MRLAVATTTSAGPVAFRYWVLPLCLFRVAAVVLLLLLVVMGIKGQDTGASRADEPYVLDGVSETMAYSLGRSLRINGTAKDGAIALGGDVIVQGTVEGDVAAIGGSVIQLEGSSIGGDVFVLGGSYRHAETANRNPTSTTIMYAGYEEELREMMRDPSGLLKPSWSAPYIGVRLLAILFWFVVSLALTAAMPGTISRGVARLQLTSLRVAVIGVLGALVMAFGVPVSLRYLPTPISVAVTLLALLLILIAWIFGRVMIHAATGRWLQRRVLPFGQRSESVALLVGTSFWIALSSLPYVWPLVVAVLLVTSLGLGLTARYPMVWKGKQNSKIDQRKIKFDQAA